MVYESSSQGRYNAPKILGISASHALEALVNFFTDRMIHCIDTESAREARKSFYCELCQKGYSRINEFEAHEGSYDHQHKKRLKEMKQMSRDPLAAAKARKAERRADEKSGGITIKPVSLPSAEATKPTGFKKGGFKNAFGNADDDEEPDERRQAKAEPAVEGWKVAEPVEVESDEEWGDYDPRRPTGCWEGCPSRR